MRLLRSSTSFPVSARGAVAAIGNFDGVHLGHRALIASAKASAAEKGKPLAVITFEPHPRRFFMPSAPPFRLDALETKARVLSELGVAFVLAMPFDAALAKQSPEEFVDHILERDLGLSHVVVGYDFTFGKARAGDTKMLAELGRKHGIGVTVIAPQGDTAEVFSSTRVRRLLEAGEVAEANRILGRPWEIVGVVEHGDKRGRELGYPTANVALTDFLVPKHGIYAVRCMVDGESHDGVASLGIRPTFDQTDVKLEVYLFEFAGDLYGQTMRVEFHGFIRPEEKFEGIEPLKAKIAADVEAAKGILDSK